MNVDVKALHFSLKDEEREYLDKKLTRIKSAEPLIVDLIISLSHEGATFTAEATVNFKWGVQAHVKEDAYDLQPAVDKMMDKLESKITKEKEKNQEKR
ncbi:ribosomal biogenesis GTPase [Spirochaetia bacterium]|nr:ribosomal biogenesis GTPase [Spirochaetia bacterium]